MCFMQSCWLLRNGDYYGKLLMPTLCHGSASVESGFSVNKELLSPCREYGGRNHSGPEYCFDAVRLADMDVTQIDISKMMADVRQSNAAYYSALQCQKDKQSQEENLPVRTEKEVNDSQSAAAKQAKAS